MSEQLKMLLTFGEWSDKAVAESQEVQKPWQFDDKW